MARLVYSVITSLDGCVADKDGKFDWAAPDVEVHAFVNDLELMDERRVQSGVVHLHYRVSDSQGGQDD
jgi:hypothetical protein